MNQRSHRKVDGRHYLVAHFHNRHFRPLRMQVFRHFESDKSGSYHYGFPRSVAVDICFDFIRIRNVSQREDSAQVYPRQGWTYGGGTG